MWRQRQEWQSNKTRASYRRETLRSGQGRWQPSYSPTEALHPLPVLFFCDDYWNQIHSHWLQRQHLVILYWLSRKWSTVSYFLHTSPSSIFFLVCIFFFWCSSLMLFVLRRCFNTGVFFALVFTTLLLQSSFVCLTYSPIESKFCVFDLLSDREQVLCVWLTLR